MVILSIDAGTTGVTAQLINQAGKALGKGYHEFEQHFPQPGWVEHEPEQIWRAVLASVAGALDTAGLTADDVRAIGITNQRETVAVWDRQSLSSPCKAIVWQDRRTANLLTDAKFADAAEWVRLRSGLPLDPYFSSSKLLWIKRNDPQTWSGIEAGTLAIGTIDSYLLARITCGAAHLTDASNASRTQLMNLESLTWDHDLLDLFEIPASALPAIRPNIGHFADSAPDHFLGITAPVTGMAGDQQAALFGQLAFEPGDAKCTYGTGAFLLQNTGGRPQLADPKLIATIAWVGSDGTPTYALEGSVFVAGAAIQWLRDGLQIIHNAAEIDEMASQAIDNGGLYFVPALTGLGAPFWDSEVRGSFLGITRGTSRNHFARATLEAVAFEVRALVQAFTESGAPPLERLRVDGGLANSNVQLQLQADALQIALERPSNLDTTGLGAAYLAGLGASFWSSVDQLPRDPGVAFTPGKTLDHQHERWLAAVAATRSWTDA